MNRVSGLSQEHRISLDETSKAVEFLGCFFRLVLGPGATTSVIM